MPAGGTYTIDSSDLTSWQPTTWRVYSMPAGGTYAIDTGDMAAWLSLNWRTYSMPAGSVVISANTFDNWVGNISVYLNDNSLSQEMVDLALASLWAMFPSRTATAGGVSIGGTNAAPSGLLQAANPPTTGKEYAYELVNDSQNVNPTKKWTSVTITE